MKKNILIFIAILFLAGCSVRSAEVPDSKIKVIEKKMKFFKHEESGLCFGVIGSRKPLSLNSSGLGLSLVPCEDVEDLLIDLSE